MIFKNTENSKINEPHEFVLNLSQGLNGINMLLFKTYLLQLENIIQQYYKIKIIPLTWNDKLGLHESSTSVSHVPSSTNYIIEKHETLTTNYPILIYINRFNNRLVFKKKDGCNIELQTRKP